MTSHAKNEDFHNEDILKRLYNERGLTQKEMAEELDCAVSTISKWMGKFNLCVDGAAEHKCDYCGEKFQRPPSSLTGGKKFCNRDCEGKFKEGRRSGEDNPLWEGGRDVFVCDHCGKEYEQYQCHIRGENTYCSVQCRGKDERKEKDRYYGPNWNEIRKEAIRKCNGTCDYNGCQRTQTQDGRSLHVHHKTPLVEFENHKEANKISNLIPLCAEHHAEIEA